MELEFSTFSIFLTSLLFVFMILKLRKRIKDNGRSINLPPGPWKLPVIGNLHQLVNSLPHHRLTDLAKKYGPLMHLQIGEIPTVVVSSPEFAKEMLKTHDLIFASRPYNFAVDILCKSSDIFFSPYGEYWRQLRKICMLELLSMKRVQSFRSIREEEVSSLINWINSREGSPINLTKKIYSLTNDIIFRTAFGIKREKHDKREEYASIVLESLGVVSGFCIVDMFPSIGGLLQRVTGVKSKLNKLQEERERILDKHIEQHNFRKRGENEDLVDVLMRVKEDAAAEVHLTIDRIKFVLIDLFLAGTDTSASTLDWAMVELMRCPRIMKIAQSEVREVFNRIGRVDETSINEMKYLKAVIKETLRLHPPAPFSPRECGERCEIKGFEIPKKTRVLINIWAIGRDPNHWSEPDSFIPERFLDSPIDFKGTNFEYIPFGAGRRICPAMSYGVANLELPLAMLLYHFNWKLPNEMKHEDLNMTECFGLTVRRKEDLHLVPIPYHPPAV